MLERERGQMSVGDQVASQLVAPDEVGEQLG